MANNLRLLWYNLIDLNVTLTASSATTSATNIAHEHKGKVWRTSGTSATLIVDLQAPDNSVRCFALTGHNFTANAVIQLAHSTDNVTYTDIAGTNGNAMVLAGFFTLTSSRYWRFTLTDTNNPDGYLEVGRIFLGDYIEPSNNIDVGYVIELASHARTKITRGLQRITDEAEERLRVTLRLSSLTESEALLQFIALLLNIGSKDYVFLSIFPEYSDSLGEILTLYGRFVQLPSIRNPAIGIYAVGDFVFEESI